MALNGLCNKHSIVNRPKKASAINHSNAEIEYAKEQQKLAARKQTRQALADYRGATLWGTADQKHALSEQHKSELNAHKQAKQAFAHDSAAEKQYYSSVVSASDAHYAAVQAQRAAATKAYYSELQATNKQLAQHRANQKQTDKTNASQPPAPDNLLNSFGRHAF